MSAVFTWFLLLTLSISAQEAADPRMKWIQSKLHRETVPVQVGQSRNAPAPRIINGMQASLGDFPWYAAIVGDSMALCGGSLISSNWVLTAAHCTYSFDEFEIYLGSVTLDLDYGAVHVTTHKRTHAGYNKPTHMNDIALLQLTETVTFTASIKSIRLPLPSDAGKTYVGQLGAICGYGATAQGDQQSYNLMYAELPIISRQACMQYYGSIVQTETLFCTLGREGTSTCNGDSGGALFVREDDGQYTQIGLDSFGSAVACSNYPTGYTNVSSHLQWIRTQMA